MLSIQGKYIFLPLVSSSVLFDDSIVASVIVMSIIVTGMLGDAGMFRGPYVFVVFSGVV